MIPVLFIAVPLILAFISVMMKKMAKIYMMIAVLFNVVYSVILGFLYEQPILYEIGGFRPPFGISLYIDEYCIVGIVLLNLIFALIVLLNHKKTDKYATVLSIALAAMNGAILTSDLFNLFVFMEIMAITAYIFTTINKGFKHTFNYLVLGTLGSGLFLFGIIVIYNMFGTLNMLNINYKIVNIGPLLVKSMALPIVLMFVGFSVEAKLLPFSGWVRGVLKNANGMVGALILSAYSTAVLIAFGRVIDTTFILNTPLAIAFIVIAVATLTLAEFSAFSKKNIREILLFSSIAQAGMIVLLFIYGLYFPAILVLVSNVISKAVLFSIAGKIADETGTDNIYELSGIFAKYKALGLAFSISSMSIIGLPMFYGFVAKANVLISLFQSGNIWLPIVILLVAVIEGVYFMRILTNLWNTGKEGELAKMTDVKEYDLGNVKLMSFVALFVGLVIILMGILPLADIRGFLNNGLIAYVTGFFGGV